MRKIKSTAYISFGLVVGLIIGLFLDMYQVDFYGAVGLGIVYTPMIGLCLAAIVCHLLNRQSTSE